MDDQQTPWRRFAGPGMYPAKYASLLVSPLRNLISPPSRIADRLQLASTDRVLEVGCGPGFFSPTVARRLINGHLTIFDAQQSMLEMAVQRIEQRGLANFSGTVGQAEALPFADESFDVVFMVTVLGEVPNRAAALMEVARVLRPRGKFSSTEAAGDPDYVKRAELDALAKHAGLEPDQRWMGVLIKTFNYRKPAKAA
jgi:ubiquinone/menaquinone biosynthesis C-methylase UbiE